MATLDDVRRIALELPEVFEEAGGSFAWRTKKGLVVWQRGPRKSDLVQLEKLGRAWPDATVVAVRVTGDDDKQMLLAAYPESVFTIPHFDGYPAVLVRLDTTDDELLRDLIVEAWKLRVTRRQIEQWLASNPSHP
ncbi:MAG: hypothetical protein KF813_02580 [Trueperaceae bacterium]|nr:hypothetical protein [Trueperaceae bacterium]